MDLKEIQNSIYNSIVNLHFENVSALNAIQYNGLSKEKRLAVYGHAYFLRLIGFLKEEYDTTCALLGEDKFEKYCRDFIKQIPSTYNTLASYSLEFAEYLFQHLEVGLYQDLVDFEKSLILGYYRAYNKNKKESFPKCIIDQSKGYAVKLNSSVILLQSYWPLARICIEKKKFHKGSQKQSFVLWTVDGKMKYETISNEELIFLEQLKTSSDISILTELLFENLIPEDKILILLQKSLPGFIQSQVIVSD